MAVACADLGDYSARVSRAVAAYARSVAAGDAMGVINGELVFPLPRTFDAFLRTMRGEMTGRFSDAFWDAGLKRVEWFVRGERYWALERQYAVADSDDFDAAIDAAVTEHWELFFELFPTIGGRRYSGVAARYGRG